MQKLPEQPDSPDNTEDLNEPRYEPGEYRIEIPVDTAREDIENSFLDFKVERIEYLSEGIGSTTFLVNGEFVFRFAKNEQSSASTEKEIKVLPEIQTKIDVPVPIFEYVGSQRSNLRLVGYKKIEGDRLEKVDEKLTRQLATFFQQLHSIDIATAEQWRLHKQNFHSFYENELEDARGYVYSLLKQAYPADAQRIKDYIEQLFATYLSDKENFKNKPAVLHGDLEAEHIIFNKQSRKIAGIIDWGGARIGDPDYDLWRPYSHYGSEFVEEFLKHCPHQSPECLQKKLDFFFRAQMIHRTVRQIMLGDQEMARWNLVRVRKQALGIGYWYHELRED